MAQMLSDGQTVVPESLEHASVMTLSLSNFSDLSSNLGTVLVVNLLNAVHDVIDKAVLEQDVDRMISLPGSFVLMSGLRRRHVSQHAVTLTLAALDICLRCRVFCRPFSPSLINKDLLRKHTKLKEKP